MLERPNIFAGSPLDRAAHRRRDAAWLDEARRGATARVVPVWRTRSFVGGSAEEPHGVFLPAGDGWGPELMFLGLLPGVAGQEQPIFAADLSVLEDPLALPELAGLGRFDDLRMLGAILPAGEAALLAYARGVVWWNARHRFCGVCGAPAIGEDAGHARVCTGEGCGTRHFPRTDPAVIMLVHDGGDQVLLGRQASWAPGVHSVLAGFVEPGESLEEAVAREVFEEAGVRVADVRYRHSQPWPFPSSVMLGFTARALSGALSVDTEELESAQWVSRGRLRARDPDDPLRLPNRASIARRLIEEWVAEG